MKNLIINKNRVVKSVFCIILIAVIALFQSCDTDIPPTDTEPPTFSFKIVGDSLVHTFTQDDDYSSFSLHFRNDAIYDFVYTGVDHEGLKQMELIFGTEYYEIEIANPSLWTVTNDENLTYISWHGDDSSPVNGSILKGTIKANGIANRISRSGIFFDLRDFGGQHLASNQTFELLDVIIGQHRSEIVQM